ncbi:hypothetical protein FSP39_017701 [Pinctada imbricata]|uniref:KY-like immunoglobulin-like domain-containing protein n=1 Tax=Pinctada imbricata TaxID=66713 RepID=A0AA88Y813_PINIB|nr:hypothetical protein FSP39_017701 [Pinctada imbricata]
MDNDIEGSERWQLLDQPFTLEEFSKAVKLSTHAMTWGLKFSHNDAVIQEDNTFELDVTDTRGLLIDTSMHLTFSGGQKYDEYLFFRRVKPDIFRATIKLPKSGMFKLDVFGKAGTQKETSVHLVTYIIKCQHGKSNVQPYPKHSGLWGPSSNAFDIGFKPSITYNVSHKALHGNLSLNLPVDNVPASLLHLKGTSSEENLKHYSLLETKPGGLQIHLRLPRQDFYKLEVFCKTDNSESYHSVMSFLIDGFHGTSDEVLPFPKTFPHTQEYFCELLEPTTGVLPANTPIIIRFKSPKLVKGFVKCTDYNNLKENNNVWVAEVTTCETGGVLSVNGNNTGEKSCWSLYKFDIV